MISHVAKALAIEEELSRFVLANLLKNVNKKCDKLCMVLILRILCSDFDNVHDQILIGDQILSVNNLVTKLLWVPTLLTNENSIEVVYT